MPVREGEERAKKREIASKRERGRREGGGERGRLLLLRSLVSRYTVKREVLKLIQRVFSRIVYRVFSLIRRNLRRTVGTVREVVRHCSHH